jgi:hypothetical protein
MQIILKFFSIKFTTILFPLSIQDNVWNHEYIDVPKLLYLDSSIDNLSQLIDAVGNNALDIESQRVVQPEQRNEMNPAESLDSDLSSNSQLSQLRQPSASENLAFGHVPTKNGTDQSGIHM